MFKLYIIILYISSYVYHSYSYVVDGIHNLFTQFMLMTEKCNTTRGLKVGSLFDAGAPVRSMFSKTKTPQSLRFS